MRSLTKLTVAALAICSALMSCEPSQSSIDECAKQFRGRIDGVEAVYMHNVGSYSVMVRDEHGNLNHNRLCGEADVRDDAPPNQSIWVETTGVETCYKCCHCTATVHIHSLKDIQGAGWNHGKFGSGQTTVVETK
jgi:hypothetical protein